VKSLDPIIPFFFRRSHKELKTVVVFEAEDEVVGQRAGAEESLM